MNDDRLADLFGAIDAKDVEAFGAHLTEDAAFRFGSQEGVQGRDAVCDYVAAFFDSIQALEHTLTAIWRDEGALVCEGRVTYTRHDETQVTLPFVDVFRLRDDAISEYLIYMDPGPLFA